MKQHVVLTLLTMTCMSSAWAQTSLQSQINAVDQVHQQHQMREQAARDAAIEQARQAQLQRERTERERQQRLAAQQAAREMEALKERNRQDSYVDEVRALELEQRKLDLEMKKAKVKRYDEYIDQDLKSQAAHTDVVQSGADAVRNISEGSKNLLESEGKAREKEATVKVEQNQEDKDSWW